MRRERARFLDSRERRANDESSPFSALGENGRGFDATAPNHPLSRPRTSSSKPFALVNKMYEATLEKPFAKAKPSMLAPAISVILGGSGRGVKEGP
jgi:hypothetical protein